MSTGAGLPGGTEDEWSRIVAGLEDVRRAGDRHLGAPRERPAPDEDPAAPGSGNAAAAGPLPGEAEGTGDDEGTEDDGAPYSPDPGPVTQGLSGGALLAWTVLVAVPLLLVVLALLPGSLPWWAVLTGLAAVVGAIVHLLRSLPEDRDDSDDGARV